MKISTARIMIFIIGLIVASIIATLPFYILHGAEVLQAIAKLMWFFILLILTLWLIWPLLKKSSHRKIILIALLVIGLFLGLNFYQFIKNYTPTIYPG